MSSTREDRMEAAAWMAKLQGPDRSSELEAGFRRWLAESEGHRAAFEMANEVWGDLAAIPRSEHPIRVTFRRPGSGTAAAGTAVVVASQRSRWLAAAAAVAVITIAAGYWAQHVPSLTTSVGERRTVTLDDGSEIVLNTSTRVEVDYDADRRHLRLERGEALFKVARDSRRPFVVTTGNHDVVALGTTFVVRHDGGDVAVTLLDGKVMVSDRNGDPDARASTQVPVVLRPGERIVLGGKAPPTRDRPSIEKVTAWRNGQVSLDHTSLADAIHEMNRYSEAQIVLEPGAAGAIQITGIFRAGEPEEFARAIAAAYGLGLTEESHRLVLSDSRR